MNAEKMTATEATEAANHGKAIELFEAEYERKMDAMRVWLEPLRIQLHVPGLDPGEFYIPAPHNPTDAELSAMFDAFDLETKKRAIEAVKEMTK